MVISGPNKKRVSVFVDGQNLYHRVKALFGYTYPNYDIRKLANEICQREKRWTLTSIDFYTGIPDERYDLNRKKTWDSRLFNMDRQGIKTHPRTLKYRNMVDGDGQVITIAEEKGTDIQIALDIVVGAMRGNFDVALIFSQDQDFVALAEVIREIAREDERWIKIASAFPVVDPVAAHRGVDLTKWIPFKKDLYDRCIDPRDYRPKR